MDSKFIFNKDERVLCYHGPLIYEAKIMDRSWTDEDTELIGPYYYVHYKGWKRTWDEWVPETRLLVFNDENLRMQTKLKELYKKQPAKDSSEDVSLGKRRRDTKGEKDQEYMNKLEIKLDIPDTLKGQLIDDWEYVTKNQQLVSLPRQININDVFTRYKKFKKDKKGSRELNEDLLEEVLHGLRMYFNKALGNMLLYRFERHQYAEIIKQYPDKDLVELYGAEHLLRLFVQMPSLIAHTNMDSDAIRVLIDYLTDILR